MTPDDTDDRTGFADLALRAELLRPLAALGYEEPTPIQREAIPPLLSGHDLRSLEELAALLPALS